MCDIFRKKGTVSTLQPWEESCCWKVKCAVFETVIGLVMPPLQINIYYCKSNERLCCAVLTGRRVVWSPRCPRSSLQVAVGGAEEGAKAGLAFPQGGPLPPEALLLECLRTPTERWKKKNRLKERNKEVAKKICKWREIGTEQAIQIDERVGGGESEKTRGTKGEQEKRVRCQLLWHTNTVVFSDGRLKGILKHYPTLNPSLFIIQQKCPHTHTHTQR